MPFWELERHPADSVALVDANRAWTYAEVAGLADAAADKLSARPRTFGFLGFANSAHAVASYLGALRSGRHVPLLLQADIDPGLLDGLAQHYRPDWMLFPVRSGVPGGYRPAAEIGDLVLHVACDGKDVVAPHPHLGLLLSTSGSTGSSKLVRLSYAGIAANASSIAEYLGLQASDRAITTLPLSYSFGLSILNSHLEAGGSLVLTDESLVGRAFWDAAREQGITSLSGVPATFEMLHRIRLERLALPDLRMLTQAGGRLRDDLVEAFLATSERLGLEFFVMYGQTEAGPRISYVPPGRLRDKIGSIGIAVPGGRLEIDRETGELMYAGPNVMLGYASQRDDLSAGDLAIGTLRTGDLARVDPDGYYYLTGRLKRFVKISGNRVNLDEVEAMLSSHMARSLACTGSDDDLVVCVPEDSGSDLAEVRRFIQQHFRLFPGHVRLLEVPALPRLATGKTDYRALSSLIGSADAST